MSTLRARAAPLLPAVLQRWPAVILVGCGSDRSSHCAAPDPADVRAALARIRAEALFWPACRAGAARPRALALSPAQRVAALNSFNDAEVLVCADLASVDPERLEAVFAPEDSLAPLSGPALWAALGGLATGGDGALRRPDDAVLAAMLATAQGRSPWTGAATSLDAAIEAQAVLRRAAMTARGPVTLLGMSRWKRRNLRPFLMGPDGPPRSERADPPPTGPVAVWGAEGPSGALRIEDGFLRSVGLGLRHTPPLSLTIDPLPPYFDATQPNAFEATVASATFTPALLARAARLRALITAAGVTKYNLAGGAPPHAGDRLAVLVAGQVAADASIRLGARAIRDDLGLLRATRERFPDAFLLYKPHPDVVSGLRRGGAPAEEIRRLADASAPGADPARCLDWADRVAVITSLMGFEALLRGKAVTCFGRPFYAGWGLTDDADPPPRPQPLSLDALTAAALILHPRYIDPVSGLPATPEVAVAALLRERAAMDRPVARLRRLWRDGLSWALNCGWPGAAPPR